MELIIFTSQFLLRNWSWSFPLNWPSRSSSISNKVFSCVFIILFVRHPLWGFHIRVPCMIMWKLGFKLEQGFFRYWSPKSCQIWKESPKSCDMFASPSNQVSYFKLVPLINFTLRRVNILFKLIEYSLSSLIPSFLVVFFYPRSI